MAIAAFFFLKYSSLFGLDIPGIKDDETENVSDTSDDMNKTTGSITSEDGISSGSSISSGNTIPSGNVFSSGSNTTGDEIKNNEQEESTNNSTESTPSTNVTGNGIPSTNIENNNSDKTSSITLLDKLLEGFARLTGLGKSSLDQVTD
jgi:hypothetical protein